MSILSENIQRALHLARGNTSRSGAKVVDPRSHIYLRPATPGHLAVLCADDTTQTEVVVQGCIDRPLVVAPQLFELVQTLSAGVNIKLSPTGNASCRVDAGKSRFMLPTVPANNFPLMDGEGSAVAKFSVKAQALAKAIESASRGMGKPSPGKPFTSGILLKCTDKGIYLVGTSGYTLVAVGVGALSPTGEKVHQGVIPEMGINQIQRLASGASSDQIIELELGHRQLMASLNGATVRSRLVACEFPRYEQVLSIDKPFTVELSRSALLAVLKRVGLFVQDSNPVVTVSIASNQDQSKSVTTWKLTCSANTPQGACVESIELLSNGVVPPMDGITSAKAHMNITYLASILDAMPQDTVNVDFGPSTLRVRGKNSSLNVVAIAAFYKE